MIIDDQTTIFPNLGPYRLYTKRDTYDKGNWPIIPINAHILYVFNGTLT